MSTAEEGSIIQATSRAGTVWGIAVALMGVLALMAPLLSGLTATVVISVLVLAAGIAESVYAFSAESFGKGVLKFLFGGITALCGLAMLAWPGNALAGLTMFLAAYFVVDGVFGIFAAFQVRPAKGWVWLLVSSISSIVLGGLIGYEWPMSGVWAIGVLLGIRLLFAGSSMIALSATGDAIGAELQRPGQD